ncbi:hypothetical protein [Kineothrix sp. MB12-C1]|uniref:hypothetical protein n=1 Tax=Kineothrix sp. MB12-C1 TaxID=3070215 RepID=UPI0027D2CC41|nr:hypothetical protein [Kineothrix sp. MB12-C1]WMC91273.1 hypothetical protein RBB56_10290 [Kineothrix sp. MB12-C1]
MRQRKIVIGQTYDRLKVIESLGIKPVGSKNLTVYLCECECGNRVEVPGTYIGKMRKSCGCLAAETKREIMVAAMRKKRDETIKEGSDVARISNSKLSRANKSGCTGVCYDETNGLWKSYISFKGTRYHLGGYHDKVDAITARKIAEGKFYGPFLEWYAKEYPEQWERLQKRNTSAQ